MKGKIGRIDEVYVYALLSRREGECGCRLLTKLNSLLHCVILVFAGFPCDSLFSPGNPSREMYGSFSDEICQKL